MQASLKDQFFKLSVAGVVVKNHGSFWCEKMGNVDLLGSSDGCCYRKTLILIFQVYKREYMLNKHSMRKYVANEYYRQGNIRHYD